MRTIGTIGRQGRHGGGDAARRFVPWPVTCHVTGGPWMLLRASARATRAATSALRTVGSDEHARLHKGLLQLSQRTVLQLRKGSDSELALPVGLNGAVEDPAGHARLARRSLVAVELRPPAVAVSPAATARQSRVPEPTGYQAHAVKLDAGYVRARSEMACEQGHRPLVDPRSAHRDPGAGKPGADPGPRNEQVTCELVAEDLLRGPLAIDRIDVGAVSEEDMGEFVRESEPLPLGHVVAAYQDDGRGTVRVGHGDAGHLLRQRHRPYIHACQVLGGRHEVGDGRVAQAKCFACPFRSSLTAFLDAPGRGNSSALGAASWRRPVTTASRRSSSLRSSMPWPRAAVNESPVQPLARAAARTRVSTADP